MRHFIGIDIGGTSIKYGLVNEDLTVEKDGSCKLRRRQRILETICECVERLLTGSGGYLKQSVFPVRNY